MIIDGSPLHLQTVVSGYQWCKAGCCVPPSYLIEFSLNTSGMKLTRYLITDSDSAAVKSVPLLELLGGLEVSIIQAFDEKESQLLFNIEKLWRFKLCLHGWISNKVEQCECNYETAFKDHILRFSALAPIFAEDKCFCLVWDAYISLWEEGRWLVLSSEFSWWTVLQMRKPLHLEMTVTFVIWLLTIN